MNINDESYPVPKPLFVAVKELDCGKDTDDTLDVLIELGAWSESAYQGMLKCIRRHVEFTDSR